MCTALSTARVNGRLMICHKAWKRWLFPFGRTMDIIQQCLSLAPVPYLAPAFSVLRFIWSSIKQAQASKGQLEALGQSIAQFLKALDGEYSTGRLLQVRTSTPLADLLRFVRFINVMDPLIYISTCADSWKTSRLSSRRKHHADF
jgi:hypothetical protein